MTQWIPPLPPKILGDSPGNVQSPGDHPAMCNQALSPCQKKIQPEFRVFRQSDTPNWNSDMPEHDLFSDAWPTIGSAMARARREQSEEQRQAELDAARERADRARRVERGSIKRDFSMKHEELVADLESHDYDDYFRDMEDDVFKSTLLFYLNSGCHQFDQHKEFQKGGGDCENGGKVDVEKMVKEVKAERLSDAEHETLMKRFRTAHSCVEGNLFSCGACGFWVLERSVDPEIRFVCLSLSDERAKLLKFEERTAASKLECRKGIPSVVIPVDGAGGVKTVEPWKLFSMCESLEHGPCHLHQELVDKDANGNESTLICPHCWSALDKGRVPALSVANGVDFGCCHRLGLTMPNLHELIALSRVRLHLADCEDRPPQSWAYADSPDPAAS